MKKYNDNIICFCGKSGNLSKVCDGSDWSCVTDFLAQRKKQSTTSGLSCNPESNCCWIGDNNLSNKYKIRT